MKIMVVDDSKTMRGIQRTILSELGYEDVVEAENGFEALNVYKSAEPDLVLLDWNMPMMDGITFLRSIRQRKKKLMVVMVTSEAEAKRVIEAIQLGACDYIVKPFTREVFIGKMKKYLPQAAA